MAEAKFWIMPRTGTVSAPVDSTATGVTATKGFDLARDLIGGLPELEDQIGGAMVGNSGQARGEYVATSVRDLQSFDLEFRDNRAPHATTAQRRLTFLTMSNFGVKNARGLHPSYIRA